MFTILETAVERSKKKDPGPGFIFFGWCSYDPESGKLIAKDILSDQDGLNLYAYVYNNPLTCIDQFSLFGTNFPNTSGVSLATDSEGKRVGIGYGFIDIGYNLPNGNRVRIMNPAGPAPLRASFTNANHNAINPFTGKPAHPPKGLTRTKRLDYTRKH